MNWEAIGVIAELVGALAVVITLLYVAVQIRLAREDSQVQGTYSSIDLYNKSRSHIIDNPDLTELLAKANRDEKLTDAEDLRLGTFTNDLVMTCFFSYKTTLKYIPLYERSADIGYLTEFFKRNPGTLRYWKTEREFVNTMDSEFSKLVDAQMADAANTD